MNAIQHKIPLQFLPITSTPPKRFMKICHQKLPSDFFGEQIIKQNSYRLASSNLMPKPQCFSSQIVTRSTSKNKIKRQNGLQNYPINFQKRSVVRQASTARQKNTQNYEIKLIMSILNTTKEMKRAIRKKSVQLKKQIQTNKKDELYFQLPPILLRKGITTPF